MISCFEVWSGTNGKEGAKVWFLFYRYQLEPLKDVPTKSDMPESELFQHVPCEFDAHIPLPGMRIAQRDEAMQAAKRVWEENPEGHWSEGRSMPKLVWMEFLE